MKITAQIDTPKSAKRASHQRPADVLEARDHFEARQYERLGVSPDELRKGAALVREALKDLGEPEIYVNRSLKSGLELLREGGRFSTIHDTVKDPKLSKEHREAIAAYLEGRLNLEKYLNTYGVGKDAGHTVYGSLGFAAEVTKERLGDGFLKEIRRTKSSHHINSGISLTEGAITFVLKPECNQKSTFLSTDTYNAHGEMPVAAENLPEVIWANIGSQGDFYFNSDKGSQVILDQPHDKAVRTVKNILTSDAFDRGYMEGQVRGATREEVSRIVIRHSKASNGVNSPQELEAGIAEAQQLAKKLGIPCIVAD